MLRLLVYYTLTVLSLQTATDSPAPKPQPAPNQIPAPVQAAPAIVTPITWYWTRLENQLDGKAYEVFELPGTYPNPPRGAKAGDYPVIAIVCSRAKVKAVNLRVVDPGLGAARNIHLTSYMANKSKESEVALVMIEPDNYSGGTDMKKGTHYTLLDLADRLKAIRAAPMALIGYDDAGHKTVARFDMPKEPESIRSACGLK